MAGPADPVVLTRAQAERLARAAELLERLDLGGLNQGPLPVLPPSDGARPVWVVKVTGPAATSPAADVGLYPARCRQLAYSAGTSTWTTVKSNGVDEMPCWALPVEGGYVGPGVEGFGLLYEQHKDTGVPIFLLGRSEGGLTWRVTGNNGSTSAPLYSGTLVYQTGPATWADVSPAVTVANKIVRVPSNATAHSTSADPPFIPNGQYVTTWPDPDQDGYYRETNAAGGLTEVPMKDASCNDGYLIGRDLRFQATSPPPPPSTAAYYCVDGQLVYVPSGGTPPPKSDCGPSTVKIDCATCSGTAVAPAGGIGITDSTAYADPYTVGDTKTLSLAKTGAFTGTPTWNAYAADPATGEIVGADTGTGNTFAPTLQFDAAGTVDFLVMLTDSGDATKLALATVSRSVLPAAIAKITANTTLDDTYLGRLVVVNASGGNVTVTLPSAVLRGRVGAFRVKRDPADVSGNTVTVAVATGENLNGVTNGTKTVAAGVGYDFQSNDRDSWESF